MNLNNVTSISIIVPVLNEAGLIGNFLKFLKANSTGKNIKEIIVVDGGSTDSTVQIASDLGATIICSEKGRAKQMNTGAQYATGTILYFLHVDTLPPQYFDQTIIDAITNNYPVGCFQMKFDSDNRFLSFFAWFTRINHKICRGGDQSLYISKDMFVRAGGFNEKYAVYEDNEFIGRLYSITTFKVLPRYVKTSARRYEAVGILKLQYHFAIIHLKNYFGAGPEQLYAYYQRKITV